MKSLATIVVTAVTAAVVSVSHAAMDHPMGSHDSMGGEMKHGMEMKMPEGMSMKTLRIDDYKVMFHVMTVDAHDRMMKMMKMKGGHSGREAGATHHIMVDITDAGGNKITDAVVKVKVIDPEKGTQVKALKAMMGHYGADFKMVPKGKYQIMTLFKVDGAKHKGGFWYEKE